jgi:hypothetical protein
MKVRLELKEAAWKGIRVTWKIMETGKSCEKNESPTHTARGCDRTGRWFWRYASRINRAKAAQQGIWWCLWISLAILRTRQGSRRIIIGENTVSQKKSVEHTSTPLTAHIGFVLWKNARINSHSRGIWIERGIHNHHRIVVRTTEPQIPPKCPKICSP